MAKQNVRRLLEELHASLSKTENPDAELRALLKQLEDDIHQLLINNPENTASPASMLTEQLRALGTRFANDHPQLDPILRELADTLGKMGI